MITLKSNSDIKIGIIGGDLRQLIVAKQLLSRGFNVILYGFELYTGDQVNINSSSCLSDAVKDSDVIILPLPYSTDGVNVSTPFARERTTFSRLISLMCREQLLLGGRLDKDDISLAESNEIRFLDYFDREELNISNAIPTAEGAVSIAMKELSITIHSSEALVLGFGRVGKILSYTLKSLGAHVTVAARREEDLTWIKALGMTPYRFSDFKNKVPYSDVIFNTVPKKVIDGDFLLKTRKESIIIDLASKPGGVDLKTASEHNIKVIWALSLPGKVAPVTAGKIICNSILNILSEEGVVLPT